MELMKKLVLVLIMVLPTMVFAADELADENKELKARLEILESELQSLKEMVMQKETVKPAKVKKAEPVLAQADIDRIIAQIQEDEKASGKNPLWSKLDIQLYGYLRADMAFDNSSVTTGSGGAYTKWADSEATDESDGDFYLTARRTRVGMNFSAPEENGIKTNGKLEFDFAGSSTSETSVALRLRHAYFNLDFGNGFSLLAGQTWDVISPLTMPMINSNAGWWTGNIGQRRAMLRATQVYNPTEDSKLKLAGAIARNIGGITDETGAESGQPSVQGRIGYEFPTLAGKNTTVGISGHYGKEEDGSDDYDSWSVNFDFVQPITKKLTIKGEMFTGENLSAYGGSIGQNLDKAVNYEMGSTGAWVAGTYKHSDKWNFNAGLGVEDMNSGDIATAVPPAANDRTLNRTAFGNAIYALTSSVDIGFELSNIHTEHQNAADGDAWRTQMMFMYKF